MLIVPLKQTEYGFGYIIIRSPYTPYSIYLRGTNACFKKLSGVHRTNTDLGGVWDWVTQFIKSTDFII